MKYLRTICLVSLGGLLESRFQHSTDALMWLVLAAVTACGWAGTAAGQASQVLVRRLRGILTGRPLPMPETDPMALAAEIKTLNAQLSQLRDTATSFDVSFDQTLERLNDRLSRLEQQSAYVQVGRRSV